MRYLPRSLLYKNSATVATNHARAGSSKKIQNSEN